MRMFLTGAVVMPCQKAPSAKRCIKTDPHIAGHFPLPMRQKAPSAKRCIKTHARMYADTTRMSVRKHRAPKGALRPNENYGDEVGL